MRSLRTVLLRHQMPGGTHYDWLVEPPRPAPTADEPEGLLTWRLAMPSWLWARAPGESEAAGAWRGTVVGMQELPAHRRAYLRRAGAISGRRGTVQRVDAGTAVVRQWHADGGYLELRLRHFQGLIELRRGPALRWQMRVLG